MVNLTRIYTRTGDDGTTGYGGRGRISKNDVRLVAYAECDEAVLGEVIPFLDGPPLAPGEHDAFFQPMAADQPASLFEHCARGLDQCLSLTGPLGLPLSMR